MTGLVFSVGRTEMSLSFDKILVPRTALLNPAYKNNNHTCGGLGRVCATGMYRSIGHMEFPKFKPEFLLNGKRLRSLKHMDNIEPEHICYMFIRLLNVQVFAKSRQMQQVGS